jgi:hypothetical protein
MLHVPEKVDGFENQEASARYSCPGKAVIIARIECRNSLGSHCL